MKRWHRSPAAFLLSLLVASLFLSGCVVEKASSSLERNRDPAKAVQKYVQAGMIYLRSRDMENAHRKFSRAYEISPDDPMVNNALALFYTVEGDNELVEKHYRMAIESNPDYSQARHNFASYLYSQKRYAEAAEQLKVVVKDYRYSARYQSWENLGLCYLELGEKEQATKAFQRAVQLNARQVVSWLKLAELSFEDENYQRTAEILTRLNKIGKPTPAQLWLEIRLQRILGDKDKLASLELALKNLFPGSREYKLYQESLNQE